MTLAAEIAEQPQVVARLLDRAAAVAAIGRSIDCDAVDHVLIAARGTSDHAAIYAQYLFGERLGLTVGLAAPSLLSLYGAEPSLRRALVLGISQSGASPDVVGVLESARRQGAPTVAITNEPDSALAGAADHVLDLGAGPELAVAATKTYTAELTALALLAAALRRPDDPLAAEPGLAALPAAIDAALGCEPVVAGVARSLASHEACLVAGRGYGYATSREWALKVQELARVVAVAYSAADLRHGPVALVRPGFPVLVVAASGRAADDVRDLVARVHEDGAETVVLSDDPSIAGLGTHPVVVEGLAGVPEHLAPIATIVPGQLYARHLTLARGLDPDRPHGIAKVTLTR